MKKSSLINLLTTAVIVLSYFNINQNAVCGKINAESDNSYGNYVDIKPGEFAAVQWDNKYTYLQVVNMDKDVVDISTFFCGDLCYTYISACNLSDSSSTELRAYINSEEYISLYVYVNPQNPSGDGTAATTKKDVTNVSTSAEPPVSTVPSSDIITTTKATYTSGPNSTCTTSTKATSYTSVPDITCTKETSNSFDYDYPITQTVTTSASQSSFSSIGDVADPSDDAADPTSDSSVNSDADNEKNKEPYYGTVMNANEYGDVNSDGKVDTSDLTRLSLALLGDIKLTPAERFAADVIPSPYSIPDLADLTTLKQFLMKDNVTLGPKHVIYR